MVQDDHAAKYVSQIRDANSTLDYIARCDCGQVARVPDIYREFLEKGLPLPLLEPWREPNEIEAEEIDNGLPPIEL